jgi:hydrogenase nickel incorporation protein HypA/HybF
MHEFSVATSLVETVLEIAKKQSSSKVLEVQLKVGKLRLLSLDQLRFSYEIIAKGTILEGSTLRIEEIPGNAKCPNCEYSEQLETSDLTFHFGLPRMNCPKCETPLVVEGGDECLITKLRLMIPSEAAVTDNPQSNGNTLRLAGI